MTLQDTVYQVTRRSDFGHTRVKRRNQPQPALLQFSEIPQMGGVTSVTERCDFAHTGWEAPQGFNLQSQPRSRLSSTSSSRMCEAARKPVTGVTFHPKNT